MVDELNTQPAQPEHQLNLNNTNLADLLVAHTKLIEDFGNVVNANAELATIVMDTQADAARYKVIQNIMCLSNEDEEQVYREALASVCDELGVDLEEMPTSDVMNQIIDAIIVKLRPDSSAG